jgi:glucuronokinase
MLITTKAYARAGLVGNPSDGYFGKTISFIIRDYWAEVTLFESPELTIQPTERDHSVFSGIDALARDVRQFGYYGGIRLLKASVKRFHDYCIREKIPLHGRNFTLRYASNVPPQVGMAGSSAIITACWRALMQFYQVEIPAYLLPSLVLSVENDELGIPAGLQDRVIQSFEGVVFMDFNRASIEKRGYGIYEPLDPATLPKVYIAYTTRLCPFSYHYNRAALRHYADHVFRISTRKLIKRSRQFCLSCENKRFAPSSQFFQDHFCDS